MAPPKSSRSSRPSLDRRARCLCFARPSGCASPASRRSCGTGTPRGHLSTLSSTRRTWLLSRCWARALLLHEVLCFCMKSNVQASFAHTLSTPFSRNKCRATRFVQTTSASASFARTYPTCACCASPRRATPSFEGASKRCCASATSLNSRTTQPRPSASPLPCACTCAPSAAPVDVPSAVVSGAAAETRPCSIRHVGRRRGRFWSFRLRGRRASACVRRFGRAAPRRRLRFFVLPCISYLQFT